jgi:hypothetical protein
MSETPHTTREQTGNPAVAEGVECPEWDGEAPTNYGHIRESVAVALEAADASES